MALRQAWYFMDDLVNGDGGDYFLIPSDCYVVWVTGIGAGNGGNSAIGTGNTIGGNGAGSALPHFRYPLAVKPNGYLGIQVGRGGLGGYRTAPWRSAGTAVVSGNPQDLTTWIVGDILSPEVWGDVPYFGLGYGGDVPSTARTSRSVTWGQESELTWSQSTFRGAPLNICGPALSWENGVNAFQALTGASKTAAISSGVLSSYVGGGVTGTAWGTYGASCYSQNGYSDGGLCGPGGGGGGNPFGSGGASGTAYVNYGQGGDAVGYGGGGGGGAYNGPGGNGANGFLLLEY